MSDAAICPTCSSLVEKYTKLDGTEKLRPKNDATTLGIGLEGLLSIANSKSRSDTEKVRDMKDLAERIYRDLTGQRLPWQGSALAFNDKVIQQEREE